MDELPGLLARAKCSQPLLGHIVIRLSSIHPALSLIRKSGADRSFGSWGEDHTADGKDVTSGDHTKLDGAPREVRAAAEDTLSAAESIVNFTHEVLQMCGSERQWIVSFALSPQIARKFDDDFRLLSSAINGLLQRLEGRNEKNEQVNGMLPEGSFLDPGQVAALKALLSIVNSDLKADLSREQFTSNLLGPDLAVARELFPLFLSGQLRHGEDNEQTTILSKMAEVVDRPMQLLEKDLEASETYFRQNFLLETGKPAERSEPRQSDRNVAVCEEQASGGSVLHRWIRTKVHELKEPNIGGSGEAGASSEPMPFLPISEVPNEFLCPITHDVMRDPVSTADGHTFERRGIEAWLAENSTSPITGLPLPNKSLIPNHSLRKLIFDSGVLSRLEPEQPDEVPQFKKEVCCEVWVPRDCQTLAEALVLGAERADRMTQGSAGGQQRVPHIPPVFGVRLMAGRHLVAAMLRIEREVEIVGCGASEATLQLAADACLEFHSSARLANVSVCRDINNASAQAPTRMSSARASALLEITQGSCCIEKCDLSNCAGSAIKVSGAHTSPSITHNNIHGCWDTGVVFKEGADGSLVGNKLFCNGSVAIEVHSLADPLIEDNDIFDGKQGGIFVYGRGKGHFRRNKIFRNALEGIEIKQGGRPLVEDNDIYDNLECGIFIHEAGEGRVIGNRIHSNYYAGIEIKDASAPEVRDNDVYSGRTSGMYIHSSGRGLIEGNRIHQNWLHGVYVRNKGCPHLLKNNIFKNDECGVFVTESSNPCVEHNEVHANGLAGIEVKEGSNPTIKLNRIHEGNTGGIFVLCRGKGKIYENKLYKNKLEGIEIKDGGDPQIMDNEIYENLECGIFAHDGALGRIENNRIFKNAYAGVEIKDQSNPLVKGNRIYKGHTSGVYVHTGGRGKLLENEVYENGLHGIMVLSHGNPSMSGNQVHDNEECGVVAHASYGLDVKVNQIYQNRIKNVQVVKA